MCIYIVKKQKLKSSSGGGGVRDSTERPKIGVSGVRIRQKLTKIDACHVTYK